MSLPAVSLNTLIYKAILALILKGFKRFFRSPIQRPLIAPSPPAYCPSGVALGEESGDTFQTGQLELDLASAHPRTCFINFLFFSSNSMVRLILIASI
jgi:hypothetical protein